MNSQRDNISILASYVTLKSLFDTEKYRSSYQVLQEFITYIIANEHLFSFSALGMKNKLKETFGFEIPESVVKKSLKHMTYILAENGLFYVSNHEIKNNDFFDSAMHIANDDNMFVFDALLKFVYSKSNNEILDEEKLAQSLISFLLDNQYKNVENTYIDLVSEFVLSNEHDSKIQNGLNSIREGSILYLGLMNDIHDTGSLLNPLTIFLGTEILFSLYGFNGEVHQKIAKDFLELVIFANKREKKISLRFFAETKREIEAYFGIAKLIVEKKQSLIIDKPAMRFIINGCKTGSDVVEKESDFFHLLRYTYGITEDEKKAYYNPEDAKYNLEEVIKNDDAIDGLRFVSHINKLRKGKIFRNNLDSEYIYVTNAGEVLRQSNKQVEILQHQQKDEHISDFAIPIEKMTNILWFKLGMGFGKNDFPSNVKAVLKARVVLSANISINIMKSYDEAKKNLSSGNITKEQFASRIIALRNKKDLPEDLQNDDIDANLDFTDEFFCQMEEEILSNKKALQEKDKILKEMSEDSKNTIEAKNSMIRKMEVDNSILKSKIAEYEKKDANIKRRKEKRTYYFKQALKLFLVLALLGLIIFISFQIAKELESSVPVIIGMIVNLVTIAIAILSFVKRLK